MSTKRKRTVDDNLDDEFCDTNNMISILKDAVDKFYLSTESFVNFSKAELISVMYLNLGLTLWEIFD